MKQAKVLRIYLGEKLLAAARVGKHNFCNRVARAFSSMGYRVEFRPNTEEEREKSGERRGYALFHVDMPGHQNALSFRKAYIAPFWQIEPMVQRWEWHVARAEFDPDKIDEARAADFVQRTRARVFPDWPAPSREGFVYVPLQGTLDRRRLFQTLSPVEMIEAVLEYDPRPVVATMHPNEEYSDEERTALDQLARSHSRLTIATGQMDRFLPACDLVVTENSSVAFKGYFLHKPAVLFSQIDFHHIAANVPELGVRDALKKGADVVPDYDKYLFWYLQKMSINAGRRDVEERILAACQRGGWDV